MNHCRHICRQIDYLKLFSSTLYKIGNYIHMKRKSKYSDIISKYLKEYPELEQNKTALAKIIITREEYPFTPDYFRKFIRKHIKRNAPQKIHTDLKILIFDIETSPLISAHWGTWNINIHSPQLIRDWHILSYSCKWLYEEEIYGDVLTPDEAKIGDDKRIVKQLWEFIDHADIIIGYNSIKFDEKKMMTRFIQNGLNPPSPHKSIDLYRAVKNKFGFTYNKMDYVNQVLKIKMKLPNDGMELWLKAINGVKKALTAMLIYNKQDVEITEYLYSRLLKWIPNHPNIGLYFDDDRAVCHKCGSTDLHKTKGKLVTSASVFNVYKCNNCGSVSRNRKRTSTTTLRSI